jgi:hypothetical protein
MYVLFADESGSVTGPDMGHFVLAGIAIHEKSFYWLNAKMDEVAKKFSPANPRECEFHGNPMMQGKGIWRKIPVIERRKAMADLLGFLGKAECTLFAVVLEKDAIIEEDPVEYAFEQLCSRFDRFLKRRYMITKEKNQGLLVFDESSYETTFQSLVMDFREVGHRWDILRNISEVPLFVDSRSSRFIQLADLVAYAVFRKYERKDPSLFKLIEKKFDKGVVDGRVHGLCVRKFKDMAEEGEKTLPMSTLNK